jgi:hypothetical protein
MMDYPGIFKMNGIREKKRATEFLSGAFCFSGERTARFIVGDLLLLL